jgi:hypothetical protein
MGAPESIAAAGQAFTLLQLGMDKREEVDAALWRSCGDKPQPGHLVLSLWWLLRFVLGLYRADAHAVLQKEESPRGVCRAGWWGWC